MLEKRAPYRSEHLDILKAMSKEGDCLIGEMRTYDNLGVCAALHHCSGVGTYGLPRALSPWVVQYVPIRPNARLERNMMNYQPKGLYGSTESMCSGGRPSTVRT